MTGRMLGGLTSWWAGYGAYHPLRGGEEMREHTRSGTDPGGSPSTEVLEEENPLESPAPELDDGVLDPELDDEEELRKERDPLSH